MPPENPHHQMIDNLKTAILRIESDLTVSYLNTAAESLLEVSGQRVQGVAVTRLLNERENIATRLLKVLEDGLAYTKRETVLNLHSGQQITVDYAVTPLREDDDQHCLIMELQPLDRLLRISREEGMLSSQEHYRALIRGIAHEIKNPLGGLRGAAQLLARELPEERLGDYTNIIIEEADRLRNLVDTLLGPNRAPDKHPVNIHEVLERVRYLSEAECDKVQILRDYDPSIPELLGDREQLIQATLNIVRNAVQALQQNLKEGRPAQVTLRTRSLRQFTIGHHRHRLVCSIEVIDNGPGIPEGVQESLFLPMVSGRADGAGLGLSISQSIVNRHQGLIECRSEIGRTVFMINIPLEPSDE